MQEQLPHQNIVDVHRDLVEIDQRIANILSLNEDDFLACLDQTIKHYYSAIRLALDKDDKNLENLRAHKKCLIYLLERLQDLEAGAERRHLYHQIIDKALSYASVRFTNVPSDETSMKGGVIEIERHVVLQNAVLDKTSISLI